MADYTIPTTYTDDVTDVLASHLNSMNNGIKDAAQDSKQSGTLAARPAASASTKNWIYTTTDTKQSFYCNGSAWIEMGQPARAIGTFTAFRTSAQAVSANTVTQVQFDAETVDTDGWYDTTTYRYTPQRAGWYMLTGVVLFEGGAAGALLTVELYKNGAIERRLSQESMGGSSSDAIGGTVLAQANGSTDYFDIRVTRSNSGNVYGQASSNPYTFFQGVFIGTS